MPEIEQERRTSVTTLADAPPYMVYHAFLDADALAQWLVPDGMAAIVHDLDPREGGEFRISLTYEQPDPAIPGKTTGSTDTYHGRFVTLVPNERIVQAIEFESDDPAFAGEMLMTANLSPARHGTYVTLTCEHIPVGISLEDNITGTESSLEKLSSLLARNIC